MHPAGCIFFVWGLTVRNELQSLLNLQKLDDALRQTLKRKLELPKEIEGLEHSLENEKMTLETSRSILKQSMREQHKLEKELNESVDLLKKKQNRMFDVKTNDEYKALLKEIEYTKQIHSDMEDRILHMLDDIEHLEKETSKKENTLRISEDVTRKHIQRTQEEMTSISEEMERLERERTVICQELDPQLLGQYEILKGRRGGLAVVVIQQETCPGCHLYVPPQTINEVLQTGEIRECPNCRRILYCEA